MQRFPRSALNIYVNCLLLMLFLSCYSVDASIVFDMSVEFNAKRKKKFLELVASYCCHGNEFCLSALDFTLCVCARLLQ